MTANPTVALLGTGTMGAGMAANIARAGLPLQVWNRSRDKAEPLAELGATVADTPAEAVRGADVVLTMLFDADSVAATMEQAREGLAPGAVWLQQSTVGVEGSDRLVALARDLGVVYVDAPVLGTRGPAESGALVVLAAGPEDVRDQVQPILDAIGSRTLWLGAAGEASRLKLAANAWVITVVEGIAEALALTRSLGLDPALFLEAVGGRGDGRAVRGGQGQGDARGRLRAVVRHERRGPRTLTSSWPPPGAAGVELAVVEAARDHLARALAAGHGDQDLSATYLEH